MSFQGIVAEECLLFATDCALDFLLARAMDCVLMPGQIVRPGKDSVAGFACCRIDALALVGT